MKQCKKCNQTFSEENIFCPTCGIVLDNSDSESSQFCSSCGIPMTSGNSFCTNCGKPVPVEIDSEVYGNERQVYDSEKKEFHFSKENSLANIFTDIVAEKNMLMIQQYKKTFFIKYSTQMQTLNIYDVTDVITKKQFNANSIIFLILSLILLTNSLWFIIGVALSILMLKCRYVYIYQKNGCYISIPEEASFADDLKDLIAYIRQYNPSAIKTNIDIQGVE